MSGRNGGVGISKGRNGKVLLEGGEEWVHSADR